MDELRFYFDNLWRWKLEMPEVEIKRLPDLDSLRKSEWSPEFERLMRNRLVFGAIRYGLLHAKDKKKYDRIASIIKRLKTYKKSGNKELLVDAANLCLLEFEECDHPTQHFHSIDDGEHVKSL